MISREDTRLIFGGGDLIAKLDEARALVANGQIIGLSIVAITSDDMLGYSAAVVDGTPAAWSRMVAAMADSSSHMLANAVEDWD